MKLNDDKLRNKIFTPIQLL